MRQGGKEVMSQAGGDVSSGFGSVRSVVLFVCVCGGLNSSSLAPNHNAVAFYFLK